MLAAGARAARPRLAAALGAATLAVTVALVAAPTGGLLDVIGRRAATVLGEASDPNDQRPDIWREALRQIRSAPLAGHGPGSFPDMVRGVGSAIPNSDVDHAHNFALTLAAESGLLGLGSVLALVGVGVVAVVRARRARTTVHADVAVVAGAGLAVVLGQGLLDYPCTTRSSP